jgi:hypothetical protein
VNPTVIKRCLYGARELIHISISGGTKKKVKNYAETQRHDTKFTCPGDQAPAFYESQQQ